MSVAQRKKFTQDPVKLLKSNRDYVTGMETCEFIYEWTINGVEYDPIEVKSPKFSSHYSDFNDEWILKIDPNCKLMDGMTYVSIQLQPTSFSGFDETLQLQAKYHIKLFADKKEYDQKDISDRFTLIITDKLSKKVYLRIDYLGLTLKDALLNSEFLQKFKFKICCIIKMSKKLTNNSDVTSKFTATQQLSADLEKLLLNDKSADITIKVGQKSFRAIKGILGARSPVFAAMFNHEQFKENKTNEVVIEDIDEGIFEEFLHFIYTDESPNVDKMPMELLDVAEKYQVNCLKNICEAILCETINFNNIASILVCSDKYNLKILNEKCLKFMKKNLQAILSNETFKIYKNIYPEAFVDVLEELLAATSQKPVSFCKIL